MSIHRNVFRSDEVADLVFKVIGEIEPVGETHTDDERFCHLQNLLNTLDILIDEVAFVLPCEERYEYSMQRAGQEVRRWIEDKHRQFALNLDTAAQPDIIRCQDCRHWRPGELCGIWDHYISNGDFYCGCAERGTDEN